jgi:hypothetical protein
MKLDRIIVYVKAKRVLSSDALFIEFSAFLQRETPANII